MGLDAFDNFIVIVAFSHSRAAKKRGQWKGTMGGKLRLAGGWGLAGLVTPG